MSDFFPKSLSAMGGRRARQLIVELKARRMELLRDLVTLGRPKTSKQHAECNGITRELEHLQVELAQLQDEHGIQEG